jgi:RNA polymerase sigma-70 factor (ECF subfamily)
MPAIAEANVISPARLEQDLASIHAQHAEFVWVSLQRLGVREADVEDMLQEVFVVVHQRLHTFNASSLMRTWLYGICVRVAAGYRRRAYMRRERTGDDFNEPIDEGANPEDALARGQARERLYAILDTMDIERRALFVMYEIDEVSCEEIAQVLGIPIGTVYSRLHAARNELEAAARRFDARDATRRRLARGGGKP